MGTEVAFEVYRQVVKFAERGVRIRRVRLPLALFEGVSESEKAMLKAYCRVKLEPGDLTEPEFLVT